MGILITGASTGIGEACALRLDALGFRVLAGIRNPADGEALRDRASDRLTPVRLDVTDPASVRSAVEDVARTLGGSPLRGLVNNAGIAIAGPLEFIPMEALRRQLEVNVVGPVAVTQAFLPLLRPARGRIVNMGSIAGRFASPLVGPYAASKFALEALTDALRVELRPWGIHVAIVEPGVIRTPIWAKSLDAAERLIGQMPREALSLYGPAIETLRRRVASIQGIPAERVADAVVHALTARRPRARYLVGRDARLTLGLTYLPTGVRDWLVGRGIRHRPGAIPPEGA